MLAIRQGTFLDGDIIYLPVIENHRKKKILAYLNRKHLTGKWLASVSLYIIDAVSCSFRKLSTYGWCFEFICN